MLEKLLVKATRYCAVAERSEQEVCQKLAQWGADELMIDKIIHRLKLEFFIDEQRYANAFVHDKAKLLKWGRVKITYHLRQRRIDENMIDKALSQIDEQEYEQVLQEQASQKVRLLGGLDQKKRNQLYGYLLQKGYEQELVQKVCEDFFGKKKDARKKA